MSVDAVLIRAATAADCPKILSLLQELAKYEGMPDGVLINAKNLEEDGFGSFPFYKCLVAEDPSRKTSDATVTEPTSGALVGYIMYFYAFAWEGRTLYMEDIYVTPTYRAKGLGARLWTSIIKLGLEAGAHSCRFCVLDWNAPTIAFYMSRGTEDVTATEGIHYIRMAPRKSLEQLVARDLPSNEKTLIVRPVTTADLPSVMEMKGQLAAEAGLNFDTKLTLEELTAGVTSSPPICHVMVAETPKAQLLGFALYTLAYSTWNGRCFYLEDLFVKPDSRKTGLSTRLLKASFQHCLSLGCCRCDFVVPATNASAMAYYQKLGAVDITKTEGWLLMCMDKEAMANMANREVKKQ